jgi:hypothetical protein
MIQSFKETKIGNTTVRVWRKEADESLDYDNTDIERAIRDSARNGIHAIRNSLKDLPRLVRIQVVDQKGRGWIEDL